MCRFPVQLYATAHGLGAYQYLLVTTSLGVINCICGQG
jgi:hypothetical protein